MGQTVVREGLVTCCAQWPPCWVAWPRTGNSQAHFFLSQDGGILPKEELLFNVQWALNYHGVDASGFSGHNFAIGVTTAAD